MMADGSITTLTKLFLSNLVNKQRYIHSSSEIRGELTLLYYDKHIAHMINWINEAKKTIKSLLTPEAFTHVFENGNLTTRSRRFDINPNLLSSYAAAVSQRSGNPQDNPIETVG